MTLPKMKVRPISIQNDRVWFSIATGSTPSKIVITALIKKDKVTLTCKGIFVINLKTKICTRSIGKLFERRNENAGEWSGYRAIK